MLYASSSDDIFSFSSEDISKKYAARLVSDTPGKFTALKTLNGELVAFKPDSISVVSGINPNNYYISTISGIGAIDGRSAVNTPQGIIFLARRGFYIYQGSTPQFISEKLNARYKEAVSGFDGVRYFSSALREDGVREMLVYDTERGLWHIEDDFKAAAFFGHNGGFYAAGETALYKTDSGAAPEWSFTLAPALDGELDNFAVNEIYVFAKLSENSALWLKTAVGDGDFKMHAEFTKVGHNVFRCPVRFREGSRVRLCIAGRGDVTVYRVEKKYASGGRRIKEV